MWLVFGVGALVAAQIGLALSQLFLLRASAAQMQLISRWMQDQEKINVELAKRLK